MRWVMRSSLAEAVTEALSIQLPGALERWREGFPVETGLGQEVGYCDLSHMCQPPRCYPKSQTEGWQSWGLEVTLKKKKNHECTLRKWNQKPLKIVHHTLRLPLPLSLFTVILGCQFQSNGLEETESFEQKVQL